MTRSSARPTAAHGARRGSRQARISRLELADYQRLSRRTAQYPRSDWLAYPALGLAGEAGEVAEHAKKAIRDDAGTVTDQHRAALPAELGDLARDAAHLARVGGRARGRGRERRGGVAQAQILARLGGGGVRLGEHQQLGGVAGPDLLERLLDRRLHPQPPLGWRRGVEHVREQVSAARLLERR